MSKSKFKSFNLKPYVLYLFYHTSHVIRHTSYVSIIKGMEGEAVGADGGGAGGAELRECDAEAAFGVDEDFLFRSEHVDFLCFAFHESLKFCRVFQIVDDRRYSRHSSAVQRVHFGADFAQQGGHVKFRGFADPAAQDDDAV